MPRWSPGESRQSSGIPQLRRHSPGLYRHQTPAELRQRPGLTPVFAGNAPAEPQVNAGGIPAERRFTDAP
ncbi:hypothetical protein DPMN_106361 [Dreissena polymorpha]|uniref:Uncharacterized protein n=1 Tax=Dreissena polymorpha TaxID=45954 RepID=A0A9D4K4U9_DREPO|nr:hypothetical protein DPMN_106361 [Dreissena polymorpha]